MFHWSPDVLDEWFTEVRPLFGADGNPAAWPSERGPRIGCQRINSRFIAYRKALGLDDGLDCHWFRRSYVTHLVEDGRDPRFVQEQVGHEHTSTTSIYTCVSSDFRTRTLRRHPDTTIAAARGAAVRQQLLELPAPVVADAHGCHDKTTSRLIKETGGTWSRDAAGDHLRSPSGWNPRRVTES